ncbi:Blm10 protein [Starmerella bacillaris]|uniref:Blm10 protein n=1 Tax=Starmerella bacillaris TaxID=1247836 RepID=A0AAV5RIJ2_STABA|nr:Blm10 protein [Starmerella bacillaris]
MSEFKCHKSVPYELAPSETDELFRELNELNEKGGFLTYDYGSALAPDATKVLHALSNQKRLKNKLTLKDRISLTKVLVSACFEAVEPSLMARYANACITLWRGFRTSRELYSPEAQGIVSWRNLYLLVRNYVVLGDVPLIYSRNPSRDRTPAEIALALTKLLRPTIVASESEICEVYDELLSFIDPCGHTGVSTLAVLESLHALTPYRDPNARKIVPMLFELWNLVPREIASRYILASVADFVEQGVLSGTPSYISESQLRVCFQGVLHALMIPLNGSRSTDGVQETLMRMIGLNSLQFAKLVVWSITPDNTASLDLLKSLVTALESFTHPSNAGLWTALIMAMLVDIGEEYLYRSNMESELNIEPSMRLTTELNTRFALIMFKPAFLGLFNSQPVVFNAAGKTCQYLAALCPEVIVSKMLGEFYSVLQQAFIHPQRLIAAISGLALIARQLVDFPQFKMHVTTLLELTLPSIDINEPGRCVLALAFFQRIASLTTFEDVSDPQSVGLAAQWLPVAVENLVESSNDPGSVASIHIDDETIAQICKGSTAAYPDIIANYMRRVFEVLELSSDTLGTEIPASVSRVLAACSDELFSKLLDLCLSEINNPQQVCHGTFSRVCGAFVRIKSSSFKKLYPVLASNIRDELEENQAGSSRTLLPKDNALLRYLSCLNMCLLAANSNSVLEFSTDISNLIKQLRETTTLSVIYTFANSIHHAITALLAYSIVVPYPDNRTRETAGLKVKASESGIVWNVPSDESQQFAIDLYADQVDYSEKLIFSANQDKVVQILTVLRTSTGAISYLADNPEVISLRSRVSNLIVSLNSKFNGDETSQIKSLLFLCKVWLCDVGYERTAKLDVDQSAQYEYEKRLFKEPGTFKRTLPPAVISRRAQLFHHQRLAITSENRTLDSVSEKIILEVVVNSCFSAYKGVKNNAFSTLHSALTLFRNDDLYRKVYEEILKITEECLKSHDYIRAEGGFSVLKYGSIGRKTVGVFYDLLPTFLTLCFNAFKAPGMENQNSSSDIRLLTSKVSDLFFSIAPYAFRLPTQYSPDLSPAWPYIEKVIEDLSSIKLDSEHWNVGLLHTAALYTLAQTPRLPLNSKMWEILMDGLVSNVHPHIRAGCLHALLQLHHHTLRLAFVGYDFSQYKADGEVEVPQGAHISQNDAEFVNDWSMLFLDSQVPRLSFKVAQDSSRPSAHIMKPNSQGWIVLPPAGIWRSPKTIPDSLLSEHDATQLHQAMLKNTPEYWRRLIRVWAEEPRHEDDKLHKYHAFLIRDLSIMSSIGFGSDLRSLLAIFTETDFEDKNVHRMQAEVVSGLLLSTPFVKDSETIDTACMILEVAINSLTPKTVGYWKSALLLAFRCVDYRRLQKVITLVFDGARPTTADNGGIKLALKVGLRTEIQAAIGWRYPMLGKTVDQWLFWDHGLQTTRESVSEEVSTALMASVRPLSKPDLPHARLNGPLRLLPEVQKSVENIFSTSLTSNHSKIEFSLLNFMLHSLQYLGGDPCLQFLQEKGMDLLLKCSIQRDDPELVVLVTKVFTELGIVGFSASALPQALQLLQPTVTASHWHQRIRMLLLLQAMFFNHLLLMTEENRLHLGEMVVMCLYDSQTEVRDLAADTLSGIVRCSPPAEQRHYIKKLGKDLMNSLKNPAQTPNSTTKDVSPKKIGIIKHASVLGLGALIGAFPYVSPPPSWMPEMLVSIAVRGAGDNSVVGKCAQQVLSNFKKTRQDSWHVDQKVFTQDQLDDLEGVLWKNYYA